MHRPDVDLAQDWLRLVDDLQQTVVIAITLVAILAMAATWSRTRSFAPTVAVVLVGAVAVWVVSNPALIRELVERDGDRARTHCTQEPGSPACGGSTSAEDLDTSLSG